MKKGYYENEKITGDIGDMKSLSYIQIKVDKTIPIIDGNVL